MNTQDSDILTKDQNVELRRLKAYFPFRIAWAVVNAETGEFHCGSSYTTKPVKTYMRKGPQWLGFILK